MQINGTSYLPRPKPRPTDPPVQALPPSSSTPSSSSPTAPAGQSPDGSSPPSRSEEPIVWIQDGPEAAARRLAAEDRARDFLAQHQAIRLVVGLIILAGAICGWVALAAFLFRSPTH